MFLTQITTRFAALATLTALFAGTASATRVTYGNVYCSFACDAYEYCVGGGHEELPSSEEECDFNDPDFFACYLQ